MAYHSMTSEKYWEESLTNERLSNLKKIRRQQMSNLTTNLFATFSIAIGVFVAIKTMPTWLPSVVYYLHLWGIL